MTGALLKTGRFDGEEEGHLMELLAYESEALHRFVQNKADMHRPGVNTTLARVPYPFLQGALDEMFIDMAVRLYGRGAWIEKTPGANNVHLAPRFLALWPRARFIFVRRRAIENVNSHGRKFPTLGFAIGCEDWSATMEAWLAVRSALVVKRRPPSELKATPWTASVCPESESV